MAYNRYNNKNKKSYKKKTNKKTSSYKKKSNFSKKQYKIIKSIASKVSQNNNNVEWKQLVCDYTFDNALKNVSGDNGHYNFKFMPITQLLLKYTGSTDIRVGLNGARGLFTDGYIRSAGGASSDLDDDTKQIINGRRINIKSIYVKGYIKYKLDVDVNTPQSAGFIIYKQKYNKDSEHFEIAGTNPSEYCPDINDMYKDGVEPGTTGGVLNMKYMALTDPLKKREFIPLMKFTKTIYKTDTDMTEYNFKVSKFYKFKNGLPVKWNDKINDYVDNPTGNACIALSEINNLYFVPWFSYIPTEGDNNWEMNLKIYVNYTDS